VGVVGIQEALQMAQSEGLDLVEVSSSSTPPVCRILDYGKFKYQQTRKGRTARKENRIHIKFDKTREVRLKPRIGEHDRISKVKMVERLLAEGSKVKIVVRFRGREITHPEFGMTLLKSVADDLTGKARLEKVPAFEGRSISMTLAPEKSIITKGNTQNAKTENT